MCGTMQCLLRLHCPSRWVNYRLNPSAAIVVASLQAGAVIRVLPQMTSYRTGAPWTIRCTWMWSTSITYLSWFATSPSLKLGNGFILTLVDSISLDCLHLISVQIHPMLSNDYVWLINCLCRINIVLWVCHVNTYITSNITMNTAQDTTLFVYP